MNEECQLKLKRASIWGDLFVAGKSLLQIAELFLVTVNEVRRTLWETGFNFNASKQCNRPVWILGFPVLMHYQQYAH